MSIEYERSFAAGEALNASDLATAGRKKIPEMMYTILGIGRLRWMFALVLKRAGHILCTLMGTIRQRSSQL